jgi:hypothetical protein
LVAIVAFAIVVVFLYVVNAPTPMLAPAKGLASKLVVRRNRIGERNG